MVSTFARATVVACVLFAVPVVAQTQEAVDGYKPPSAAKQKPDTAPKPQSPGPVSSTAATSQPRGGAAQTPAPGAKKTVGLMVTIGDTFTVKRVGVTVFGNEEDKFPIAGWKLNDRVAASVASILKKNFKIKRIAVPAGAFAPLSAPGRLFRDYEEDFTQIVRTIAAKDKADFYLVVDHAHAPFSNTNQTLAGLGVVRTESVFFKRDIVHCLMYLTVFDPQFKKLRGAVGEMGQETFMVPVKGPHEILDDEKRLPPEAQAAVNDPRAKSITTVLLDKSLAMTLPKLLAVD